MYALHLWVCVCVCMLHVLRNENNLQNKEAKKKSFVFTYKF